MFQSQPFWIACSQVHLLLSVYRYSVLWWIFKVSLNSAISRKYILWSLTHSFPCWVTRSSNCIRQCAYSSDFLFYYFLKFIYSADLSRIIENRIGRDLSITPHCHGIRIICVYVIPGRLLSISCKKKKTQNQKRFSTRFCFLLY